MGCDSKADYSDSGNVPRQWHVLTSATLKEVDVLTVIQSLGKKLRAFVWGEATWREGASCGAGLWTCSFIPRFVWLSAAPWTAARQASLSVTVSWSLLRLVASESMMPSNHLIFCPPPLLSPSIRAFSKQSALHMSTSLNYRTLDPSFTSP